MSLVLRKPTPDSDMQGVEVGFVKGSDNFIVTKTPVWRGDRWGYTNKTNDVSLLNGEFVIQIDANTDVEEVLRVAEMLFNPYPDEISKLEGEHWVNFFSDLADVIHSMERVSEL